MTERGLPAPVRPDYGAACVEQVVPALLGNRDAEWMPAVARDARAAVLLVLDGLGWELLEAHRSRVPTLAAMDGGPISTVAPSTTACALTSITTGLAPAGHGIVGFRMRTDGSVLNVLRWSVPPGRTAPEPFSVQRQAAFRGRPVPVVTKSEFRRTGFTEAHLGGAPFHGWTTISVLVEHCRRLVAAGERLVYAYYPGVDTVAHEYGLGDPGEDRSYLAGEVAFADELVARLLDALPDDVALVVTADHGQVEVEEWLSLDAVQAATTAIAGEGRFRYLYAARGRAPDLLEAARDEYGHLAWVFSRDELLDDGWLGPGPVSAAVRGRVGDVAIAPVAPVGFVDAAMPGEARLLGAHGSLTSAEMRVPLLAARGRA